MTEETVKSVEEPVAEEDMVSSDEQETEGSVEE